MQGLIASGAMDAALFLVDSQYILEFVGSMKDSQPVLPLSDATLKIFSSLPVSAKTQGSVALDYGTGANVQFSTQPLTHSALMAPVLEMF